MMKVLQLEKHRTSGKHVLAIEGMDFFFDAPDNFLSLKFNDKEIVELFKELAVYVDSKKKLKDELNKQNFVDGI